MEGPREGRKHVPISQGSDLTHAEGLCGAHGWLTHQLTHSFSPRLACSFTDSATSSKTTSVLRVGNLGAWRAGMTFPEALTMLPLRRECRSSGEEKVLPTGGRNGEGSVLCQVGFEMNLANELWEKPWNQREQCERNIWKEGKGPGRERRSSWAWKKSGESQAGEDPTVGKDLTPGAGSCRTTRACSTLLAHATSHPPS